MRTKKSLFGSFSLLLLITLFTLPAMAQKSNFSGSWNLNESKSNLGENRFRMGASKITATQEANSLAVQSVSKNRDGEERTSTSKYNLDGSETENTVFQNFVRKSKASWSSDGKILTISSVMNFERDGEKQEIKSSEAWKISEDGKTLTIESKFTSPNGDVSQTRVYDKV